MKSSKQIIIISFLIFLWVIKPIPYEDIKKNNVNSNEILSLRGGGADSYDKPPGNPPDRRFIPNKKPTNTQKKSGIGQNNPEGKGFKIPGYTPKTSKKPNKPDGLPSGNGGGGFDDDDNNPFVISDPVYWDRVANTNGEFW